MPRCHTSAIPGSASPLLQPSRFSQYFLAFPPRETNINLWLLALIHFFLTETSQIHFWPELCLLARNDLLSPRNQVVHLTRSLLYHVLRCCCPALQPIPLPPVLFYRIESATSFSIGSMTNKPPLYVDCVLWCCWCPDFSICGFPAQMLLPNKFWCPSSACFALGQPFPLTNFFLISVFWHLIIPEFPLLVENLADFTF